MYILTQLMTGQVGKSVYDECALHLFHYAETVILINILKPSGD